MKFYCVFHPYFLKSDLWGLRYGAKGGGRRLGNSTVDIRAMGQTICALNVQGLFAPSSVFRLKEWCWRYYGVFFMKKKRLGEMIEHEPAKNTLLLDPAVHGRGRLGIRCGR